MIINSEEINAEETVQFVENNQGPVVSNPKAASNFSQFGFDKLDKEDIQETL